MRLMTYEEFWALNPAPGTKYLEVDGAMEISGHEIDIDGDDPDEVVGITVSPEKSPYQGMIILLELSTWDSNIPLRDSHSAAVDSMRKDGLNHECGIGF